MYPRAVLALFVVLCLCITYSNGAKLSGKPPVILIPGDGGSQFEAKLNKTWVPHMWCSKKTDSYFPLWLNLELLTPYVLDCLVDNMRMLYDNKTHTSSNNHGVDIRIPQFGNTTTVEWLDESQLGPTSYFYYIAEALVKQANYTRNVNIRGAPYDFRKAPNENKEYMANLVKLIEDTYYINKNQKVILIGHSMGNPYVLQLLNGQSAAWKSKFINSYVSLSGPWGGAAKTMRLMSSGDNLGVFVVNPLTARPQQRSMPSTAWLMPYPSFWPKDEIIMTGPKGNYTVSDYKRFFEDINYPTGYALRKDTEPLALWKLTPPGVEVHCLHGVQVDTPQNFTYTAKTWYDYQPETHYGDGDGTVNLRSLLGCLRWKDSGHPVHHQTYPKVDHMQILSHNATIQYILKLVMGG